MNTNPSVITGRVCTADKQPVAEARVYFVAGPVALPDITTLTNSAGKFSLSAPVDGTYQIGCTVDGFETATASVAITKGQNAHLEISLKR